MSTTTEFSTFLNGLDWNQLLDRMAKLAHSERAKSLCYGLKAAAGIQDARDLLETVKDAIETLAVEEMPWLVSLDQIPPLMEKLSKQGVAEPRELKELRQFLMASQSVREVLRQFQNKWCKTQLQLLSDFKNQISAIERVITEAGDIKEDASEKLWSLCEERRRLERSVKTTLDQVVKRRVMESILQDKYVTTREGRWVLPVKSGNQHDLKGIIHDTSQTKQTVFMEPEEVVPINNRLREVEAEIHEEIHRILTELSQYLFRFLMEFKNAERSCLNADFTWAKARLSAALNAHIPTLTENVLDLKNLRHPLLILQGEDVVANSVVLEPTKRILLLSGPNAGGKTILLKGMGLLALMARSGLPIPADEGSQIPFFKTVDPVVGDLQSVGDHLSSFSAHIQRLNQCLNYKGMGTLVLIDEIAGSTDPEEGSALARSFIESFSEQKIFCVVTSHLGPLKESWEKNSGVVHGSLEFDIKNNSPTYRLLQGIPGRSLALAVAKRFGVPDHILSRAQTHLSPDGKARVQNLEEIEELKDQILSMRTDAEKAHKEAFDLKDQYLKLVTRFREQRDRWFERALEKTEKKIDNILTQARAPSESTKSVHDIKADLPEIIKGKPLKPRPATPEDFIKQFPSGTPAYSTRLGRQVIVQGQPDNKGNVFVMADMMRLQMPWNQLMPLDSSANPAHIQKGRTVLQSSGKLFGASSTPFQGGVVSDKEEVLDLRGYRVDEAIEALEKWIDDCVGMQLDRVKIIHGFGTETLKKAVRQNLTRNRQVEKWNAGDQNSGGDGITWVQIRTN